MKNKFKQLLTSIFGQITWRSPSWWQQLKYNAYKKKIYLMKFFIVFLVLIAILSGVSIWYALLPKPQLTTFNITVPKPTQITPQDEENTDAAIPTTYDLYITFSKSAAPLNLIGKTITSGVKLTPEFNGTWSWRNDRTLKFTPSAQDWAARQKYTVIFDKSLFASNAIKLEKKSAEFTTQSLTTDIKEFKFYQDPLNPKQRQAIATIEFNYPIDKNSLEKSLVLQKQNSAKQIPFTISYDNFNRTAYLKSETLQLESSEYYLQLILNKNIKPISGNPTIEPTTKTLLIPELSTLFKIAAVKASIVRNQQDRPEQVLTIETTAGVSNAEFNKAIKVYLLPKDYPANNPELNKPNYAWHNEGEVTAEILQQAKRINLISIAPDREYPILHSYKLDLPQQGYLYVSIAKGIKAYGDYILSKPYNTIIKVPAYPKEISFLHSGSLLALNSEQKISIVTRGIFAAKITVARILPNAVNHLVSQTEGEFNNPVFRNYGFDQNNISEIFSETNTFNNVNPSAAQYSALDLGKYLNTGNNIDGPHGLFLIKIQALKLTSNASSENNNNAEDTDSADSDTQTIVATKLVLITDLGLLVKDNTDGSHDLFVQSITKGEPVANAEVVILGKNGLPIMKQISDQDGHVSFPNLKDFKEERQPTAYLVKLGSDVSFIPYNKYDRKLNYSRYEIGGITNYQNDDTNLNLNAFLFTERGIYRPGDTVHIAAIVKRPFAEASPTGFPLEVTIRDPRGQLVKEQKINLDENGYLTLDFSTDSASPTGQYDINLFNVKDNRAYSVIGSTVVNVQEFLPDRMRISAHFDPATTLGWTNPQNLKAQIQLQNLYGAPAAKRRISSNIVLSPQTVKFEQYPDYTFVDPLLDPQKLPKSYSENLPDTETDSQGKAEFALNLERFDKATYQLSLSTEGFESQGGRSVKTKIITLVSPLAHLVGYKPDSDFNFIKQNSKHTVNFIAIDPQLKMQKLDNLTLEIYVKQPVTTLIKNPDNGTYQYQSIVEKKLVTSTAFKIDNKNTAYSLDTTKIGDFEVNLKNKDGTKLSKFDYSIVGTSQQPLPKNAELSVKIDKTDYAKDQDIELQITAPYIGSGLITIERDKVYAYKWFKTTTTSSVQTIHIPKELQGNGYVSVAFVRDFDSPEIFISPLSYSVLPFTVSAQDHNINITLQTSKEALAGMDFPINYKSDKPSKIIIFAVDEGILQVSKYKTPNPLGFFFQKRSLDVETQQILDQILPKYIANRELSAVGGDGGEQEIDKNLNPFKRKIDAPVVYWSGILDSDENEHQVIYHVPDYFNGSLRIMAVAVAANAVGATATNANISNYFVINPNTPTFVAPNDTFEITASIANNTKELGDINDKTINVELIASDNLEILDTAKKQLTAAPNSEETVRYKLRAKDLLGNATLQFIASSGEKTSKISATLSIRPANPYRTSILTGYTANANKTISIERKLYPEYRRAIIASATSPLVLLAGLQDFLDNYPYLCTEQLTSKAFAALALAQKYININALTQNALRNKVQQIISLILQRQTSNGSFSYWFNSEDSYVNQFASIYAMHFITEAKAQGYNIPSDMLNSGISYLKEIAAKDVDGLEQARLQAYAIYILTRNEIVTTNYLTHLQLYLEQNTDDADHNWRKDITSAYIAATYQLLQNATEANRFIKFYHPNAKEENVTNADFYSKNITDAQYLYLVALHFPQLLPNLTQNLVLPLVDSLSDSTLNTLFAANTSLALAAYDRTNDTVKQNFSLTNVDEKTKKFELNNPLKNLLFYQLTQQGFDKTLPTKSITSGIEVFREYRINNNLVTNAKLGDEIEVHIQVRSTDNNDLSNVAIVDLLPGGFDVVRESIDNKNCDYIDAREDRVVFFCSVEPRAKELIYHIKASSAGEFTTPPIIATSMYNPKRTASGIAGKITISNPAP